MPQVHASAVTGIELSADGTGLYSGCDAAAPKPDPDAPDEPPVKRLSIQACAYMLFAACIETVRASDKYMTDAMQDGSSLRSLQTERPTSVRLLKAVRQHGAAVLCVDGGRCSVMPQSRTVKQTNLSRSQPPTWCPAVCAESLLFGARHQRRYQDPA